MRVFLGILSGLVLSGGFGFAFGELIVGDTTVTSAILAAIFGAIGATYGGIAWGNGIYQARFLSLFGYFLDLTWSILNTLAGLIVWIPACLIKGGSLKDPTPESKRSGCFVYDQNPRGPGWDTTIGTVIAANWSAHEEVHVWQARMYGPAYLAVYGLSWCLNVLFRLITGRSSNMSNEAYFRICFEDWAYWGGESSSSTIHGGGWAGGFFLTLLYMSLMVGIVIGAIEEEVVIWAPAAGGLFLFCLIRAIAKGDHRATA
jgi:hypothetical protein